MVGGMWMFFSTLNGVFCIYQLWHSDYKAAAIAALAMVYSSAMIIVVKLDEISRKIK